MTTTSDKELLELAAKAYWGNEIDDVCSIAWDEFDQCIAYTHADNQDHNGQDRTFLWNPLTDDGDSLRLAVKLELNIIGHDLATITVRKSDQVFCQIQRTDDPHAATRRAVVRAAAAIGESM